MRGVKVVVMESDFRMRSPGLANRLAQSLTLHKIEIERDRDYENFLCVTRLQR